MQDVKLVANIKLQPSAEQHKLLRQTLQRCNAACNSISKHAFESKVFRQYDIHKASYHETKAEFELSAQVVVRCISKVADSYKLDTKRKRKFRKWSAQPYDDRIFRFINGDMISIWALGGRQKIPFVCGEHQRELLKHRKGEVDLMFINGNFYIACVCDVDDTDLIDPEGALGVDFGIVEIATDSNGNSYSGDAIEKNRRIMAHRRKNLQKKGTKSAKRKLKKIAGKQARFQKITNHVISKRLVAEAKRSHCAIALEDLKGIRARVKATKKQRSRLSNWGFHELRSFVEYKAKRAGIPVIIVDPRNTSRQCSVCHHIDKANRKNQSDFVCVECGYAANADFNAALNIRARGEVSRPNGSHQVVKVSGAGKIQCSGTKAACFS